MAQAGLDPVRDAVLNFPITHSPTLPRHQPPLSASRTTSVNVNNAPRPSSEPSSLYLRRTLNDTSSSPSPGRVSSLAHIIQPIPLDDAPRFPSPDEKLSCVMSLSRLPGAGTSPDVIKVSSLPSGISHPTTSLASPPQEDTHFSPTTERLASFFTPTVEQREPTLLPS
jgi:hypothetical protein